MEVYAGLDLHSTNTYVAMIDNDNKVLYKQRHGNDIPTILSVLDPFKKDIQGVWWSRPTTGTGLWMPSWMQATGSILPTCPQSNSMKGLSRSMTGGAPSGSPTSYG